MIYRKKNINTCMNVNITIYTCKVIYNCYLRKSLCVCVCVCVHSLIHVSVNTPLHIIKVCKCACIKDESMGMCE